MKADVPRARLPRPAHDVVRPLLYRSVPERNLSPINRFYGSDWRIALRLDEQKIILLPVAPGLVDDDGESVQFTLTIGVEQVELRLPPRLVAAALGRFGAGDGATQLDAERQALLIEAACAGVLAELEATLDEPVELQAPMGQAGSDTLQFAIAVQVGTDPVEIAGIAGPASMLARLFSLLPKRSTLPGWLDPMPLPLSFRYADVRITLGELQRARPGDALLFDRHLPAGESCLLIGRYLAAPVRIDGGRVRLQTAPAVAHASQWEWLMDDLHEDGGAAESVAVLDDLPVRVVFEFGRSEMTLKELANLGAGSIVALPASLDEPVSLIANGRRIGQGEPVQIGEALGVRITRLFDA